MHQNPFADRLQSGPAGGAYAFPPDLLAAIRPTSKEREGRSLLLRGTDRRNGGQRGQKGRGMEEVKVSRLNTGQLDSVRACVCQSVL